MLQHGLQGFQWKAIGFPPPTSLKPDPDFLEERFALFRRAS